MMTKEIKLLILAVLIYTPVFSSNNFEEKEIIAFQQISIRPKPLNFIDFPKYFIEDICSNLNIVDLLSLERVNKSLKKTITDFPFALALHLQLEGDLEEAKVAYNQVKNLKPPYEGKQYFGVLNEKFLDLLKPLKILADQGFLKAVRRYFKSLENMRKGDIKESIHRELLTKKAEYRDSLISYYKQRLKDDMDDQQKSYYKYKIAKFSFFTNCDDPGNLRKKEALSLVRELEAKNFAKAFYLHYKSLGYSNPHLLSKANELGYKKIK